MEHLYEARILLVDDNPDILDMLKSILSRRGFRNIRAAGDCREARAAFGAFEPELMVLDIMLPDGDGFSLMRDFRLSSDAPVLFLSAKDEDNGFWDWGWARTTTSPSLSCPTSWSCG